MGVLVLRENLIHDVRMHNYGGWAIYADEGASHVVNERNEMVVGQRYTLADLQALGYDRYSVVADPRFADVAKRDFRLAPDSPALALGFEPADFSTVGPRGGIAALRLARPGERA